jgi:hypothetical protein
MRGLAYTATATLFALATTHCTSLDSPDDNYCNFHSCDAAAVTAVDPPDGGWWCENPATKLAVTTVLPPVYPMPAPTTVRYLVPIVNFQSIAANPSHFKLVSPNDISITACGGNLCPANGSGVIVPTPPSPSRPAYGIDLPFGFNGSILINSTPDAGVQYYPTAYSFGGQLVGTRQPDGGAAPVLDMDGTPIVQGQPIAPLPVDTIESFYAGLGGTIVPGEGLLVARLLDCNGNRAAGVTLTVQVPKLNAGATGYYLTTNESPQSIEPGALPKTDTNGDVCGYANVDPKNYTLMGTTPDGLANYGLTTLAPILPNTLNEVEVRTDVPPPGTQPIGR